VQNVRFANMMPKRRLVELNNDIHASTIPQTPPGGYNIDYSGIKRGTALL
jgi:hypothetical protein